MPLASASPGLGESRAGDSGLIHCSSHEVGLKGLFGRQSGGPAERAPGKSASAGGGAAGAGIAFQTLGISGQTKAGLGCWGFNSAGDSSSSRRRQHKVPGLEGGVCVPEPLRDGKCSRTPGALQNVSSSRPAFQVGPLSPPSDASKKTQESWLPSVPLLYPSGCAPSRIRRENPASCCSSRLPPPKNHPSTRNAAFHHPNSSATL